MAKKNAKIGYTPGGKEYLGVVKDIVEKISNGTIPLEEAKEFSKRKRPPLFISSRKDYNFTVDFNDPRWQSICLEDYKDYREVDRKLRPRHFPILRTGQAKVTVGLLTFDRDITFEGYFVKCRQETWSIPDRAIFETFLDQFSDEFKEKVTLAPCGLVTEQDFTLFTAYILDGPNGRDLGFTPLTFEWPRRYQFFVVLGIEPLAA